VVQIKLCLLMNQSNNNYICISDLHLGAKYSIFSNRDKKTGFYKAAENSDCLVKLVECLQSYLPKVFENEQPPTLIILGDIIDFSFGSMDDIITAFTQFISLLFPENNEPALVDTNIIYIPGNHDHHIWQSTKDHLAVENFLNTNDDHSYQTTNLYRESNLPSELLNALAQTVNKRIKINLRYPNMGLRLIDKECKVKPERSVYFHHGHFIEPMYRMMTVINKFISDINDPDIEELERQNGGWIDFFWSSLGASKVERNNSVLLFDIMQNPAATQRYAKKIAELFCRYLNETYSILPTSQVYKHITIEKIITGAIDSTLGHTFQLERAAWNQVLSKESIDGLRWYLSQPLRTQIMEQHPLPIEGDDLNMDTTFIFGHTHKPFQDKIPVTGFNAPVKVFNCGGWVVDNPRFTSVQGGAIVFIDKKLNVASLRLFQDPVNGEMPKVTAEGVGDDSENALLTRMRKVLHAKNNTVAKSEDWPGFQHLVKIAIDIRAKEVRKQFFDPAKSPGVK